MAAQDVSISSSVPLPIKNPINQKLAVEVSNPVDATGGKYIPVVVAAGAGQHLSVSVDGAQTRLEVNPHSYDANGDEIPVPVSIAAAVAIASQLPPIFLDGSFLNAPPAFLGDFVKDLAGQGIHIKEILPQAARVGEWVRMVLTTAQQGKPNYAGWLYAPTGVFYSTGQDLQSVTRTGINRSLSWFFPGDQLMPIHDAGIAIQVRIPSPTNNSVQANISNTVVDNPPCFTFEKVEFFGYPDGHWTAAMFWLQHPNHAVYSLYFTFLSVTGEALCEIEVPVPPNAPGRHDLTINTTGVENSELIRVFPYIANVTARISYSAW